MRGAVVQPSSKAGRLLPATASHQSPSTRFRGSTVPRHLFASVESDVTIWSLPEELLVHLLRGLHIKDLLSMRSVHPAFRDLIDTNSAVWQFVSFADTWPSQQNVKHFEKAAKQRNIESLLKLGIAYLYNEGLPYDVEGQRARSSGMIAAAMFCEVETLTPTVTPFTWLFIRPPWSAGGCCKECVFKNMLLYVKQHQDSSVALCVSQILKLFEDPESQARMVRYLTLAAQGGSKPAMYLLWCHKYKNKNGDKAMELQSARELRDIASLGEMEAQLALCRYYATKQYSASQFSQYCGVSRESAVSTVRTFVQSATPSNAHLIFNYHSNISNTMRYILVDWLVEVTEMKAFSTHTLHVAVSVMDRFLRHHRITRNRLQLLGVATMVLSSRFLGVEDIITIREAAWLTDNSYKYEDVVRMMGEVVATLQGKIRVMTSLDYLYILEDLAMTDDTTRHLAEYMCTMSLLHPDLTRYTRAEVAASCLLLARIVLKQAYPWSSRLQEFTGFTLSSLTKCSIHLFSKCFVSGKVTDHRGTELQAVKQRYKSEDFCAVSQIELPTLDELSSLLGVSVHVLVKDDLHIRYKPPVSAARQRDTASSNSSSGSCSALSTLPGVSSGTVVSSSDPSMNETRMVESGAYDGDCSMNDLDQSSPQIADLNANFNSVKSLNTPSISMATPNLVTMATPNSVPIATASVTSSMEIFRRSNKDKITPLSSDTTPILSSDISSEHPIPRDVRTPRMTPSNRTMTSSRKHKTTATMNNSKRTPQFHDLSGRHNIPCLPINDEETPMQESPTKQEPASHQAGSPMKTD